MTTVRYDGAYLAPTARLRGHGALRRAVSRPLEPRQENAMRAVYGYLLALDDASLATFGYDRGDLDPAGQAYFPF